MTRINTGVEPRELTDLHLKAEHREIVRVPNAILAGKFSLKDCPKEFTLNTGHVKFHYDKLLFLQKKYIALYNECKARGFNVTDMRESFVKAIEKHPELANDYTPTQRDRGIILERINTRLAEYHLKMLNKKKNKIILSSKI